MKDTFEERLLSSLVTTHSRRPTCLTGVQKQQEASPVFDIVWEEQGYLRAQPEIITCCEIKG
jgi:hypothetical protein